MKQTKRITPNPKCPKCHGKGEYYFILPDDVGSPNLVKCDSYEIPKPEPTPILTEKEASEAVDNFEFEDWLEGAWKIIARGQAKKIWEWGNERCLDHHTSMNNIVRRDCDECWALLEKGVKG